MREKKKTKVTKRVDKVKIKSIKLGMEPVNANRHDVLRHKNKSK